MIKLKAAGVTVQIPVHQVDGSVWCDAHSEVHDRTPNLYDEDESDKTRGEMCLADNWRPVYAPDDPLGRLG